MNTYILTNILNDYTSGCIVVQAYSRVEAINKIKYPAHILADQGNGLLKEDDGSYEREIKKEIEEKKWYIQKLEHNDIYCMYGGG